MSEAACRSLVERSAALVDAGDAAGLAQLFTDDGRLVRPDGTELRGRAAIEQAYAQRPAGRITAHLLCGMCIDQLSPDRARVTTRVLLWTTDTSEPAGPHGRRAAALQKVGRFEDLVVHTRVGWRIAERVARFEMYLD